MNNVRIQAIDDPLNFLLEGKHSGNLTQLNQDDPNYPSNINQNSDIIVNPCPFHATDTIYEDKREATHICLDEKLAICDDCAIIHAKKKNHKILNV